MVSLFSQKLHGLDPKDLNLFLIPHDGNRLDPCTWNDRSNAEFGAPHLDHRLLRRQAEENRTTPRFSRTPPQTRGAVLPRFGGISILCGFSGAVLLFAALGNVPGEFSQWIAALFSISLMFAIGLIDDCQPLGARAKLTFQFGIACIAYALGLRIELLTDFAGYSLPLPDSVTFIATIFWLMALPNIVNLIDGIDGLAGGLGIFVAITLAVGEYLLSELPHCHYEDEFWTLFDDATHRLGFLPGTNPQCEPLEGTVEVVVRTMGNPPLNLHYP